MDTLKSIKQRLNIDQRNLAPARVVSVSNTTARVRLPDGKEKTAFLSGTSPRTGDLVNVFIAGNTASIQGDATLQRTGGLKTVIL